MDENGNEKKNFIISLLDYNKGLRGGWPHRVIFNIL